MNRISCFHIIYFLLAFCCFQIGFSATYLTVPKISNTKIEGDSLQIDTKDIIPRKFGDLNKLYSDEDFIYERSKENSGWWTRFKHWLSDFIRDIFSITTEGQASNITDITINIAGVIIFLLVIYFIFKAVMNEEGKWIFGKSSDKNVIPVSDIEKNIHVTDFSKLIEEAEAENNYRLSVRYYYLWLLKFLTDKDIIEYDVEKTNSDYFNEIVAAEVKKQFAYTSYLYNYIWYGEFDVNQTQYAKAKHAFVTFLKSIKA